MCSGGRDLPRFSEWRGSLRLLARAADVVAAQELAFYVAIQQLWIP